MSVFGFIHSQSPINSSPSLQSQVPSFKASPSISVSLADDLFEAFGHDDQHACRAPPGSSSNASSRLARQDHEQEPSVFDFINQSPSVDTHSVDELVFATKSIMLSPKPFTSTALLHVGTTPPAHGQRLNEEIAWKKITTAKNNQMDILQQLYDQRHAILTMIHTNTSRIQEAGKGKEEALAQQDYSGLDQQEKQLDHWKSDILQGTQSLQQVTLRIQREWSSLVQLMRNESSSATKVAQAYQTILHDREAQFQKYQQDTRLHFQRLQDDIQKQREALAADKSELAFDQDFMKQSSIELEEKMADAVHQEKEQKEILIEKMVDIDTEIQALMQRVAELKDQRQDLQQQVDRIDQHMERALTSFLPDQQQHQTERQETDRRKQRLERQERNLDQKEAMLHQARQREQEKQNKEQTSLDALQATLDQASQQATTSYSDDLHQVLTDCLLDRDKKLLEALAEQQRLGRQVEQQRQQIHQVRKDWWAMQDQLEDGNTTLASLEMKQTRCDRQMKRALQQDLYDVASHCQMELQRLEQEISSTRNKNQTYQDRSSQQQGQLDTLQESLARLKQSYDQQWQASNDTMITLLRLAHDQLANYQQHALVQLEMQSMATWQQLLEK